MQGIAVLVARYKDPPGLEHPGILAQESVLRLQGGFLGAARGTPLEHQVHDHQVECLVAVRQPAIVAARREVYIGQALLPATARPKNSAWPDPLPAHTDFARRAKCAVELPPARPSSSTSESAVSGSISMKEPAGIGHILHELLIRAPYTSWQRRGPSGFGGPRLSRSSWRCPPRSFGRCVNAVNCRGYRPSAGTPAAAAVLRTSPFQVQGACVRGSSTSEGLVVGRHRGFFFSSL